MSAINYLENGSNELIIPVPKVGNLSEDLEAVELDNEVNAPWSEILEDVQEALPEVEQARSDFTAAVIRYEEVRKSGKKTGAFLTFIKHLLVISAVAGFTVWAAFNVKEVLPHQSMVILATAIISFMVLMLSIVNLYKISPEQRQQEQELDSARARMDAVVNSKLELLTLARQEFDSEARRLEELISGRSMAMK